MRRLLPLFIVIVIAGCSDPALRDLPDGVYAEMRTSRGTIVISLAWEKAPMTVSSFVGLAEGTIKANGATGKKYFDGLTFHRVVPGFVIQGGDPRGDGTGGPGYQFPNEISPDLRHDSAGVVAMANSGPDTNGSQFYITLAPTPNLDGGYSVFGKVLRGMDVVSAIKQGDKMTSVRIVRVGTAAGAFKVTQASFDQLVAKATAVIVAEKNKVREAALVDIRKKWPNLTTTPSGLMYEILKEGSGPSPSRTSAVSVKYTGTLLDGKVFDSTDKNGPASFQADQVIPGWTEALVTMKKGETRRLVIPPDLAYGARGYPGVIPGNAWLVFVVELVDF